MPQLPASPAPADPLALPVLTEPRGADPFVISIHSSADGGGFYIFLAGLDLLVLLGSGGMLL